MNFQFQQMKPVIQRDFDEILCHYPTDLSAIDALIAAADTVWARRTPRLHRSSLCTTT